VKGIKMNILTKWNPFREMERWNPFKEMDELHQRFSSLLGRRPNPHSDYEDEFITATAWAPAVDIVEDDKEYLIKAELPELKKDEVSVTVENGVLAIYGERKCEKEEKGRKYYCVERCYGAFRRSFALPDDADSNKVTAEFKDGLLQVHLAKSEKAKPKAIEVKAS